MWTGIRCLEEDSVFVVVILWTIINVNIPRAAFKDVTLWSLFTGGHLQFPHYNYSNGFQNRIICNWFARDKSTVNKGICMLTKGKIGHAGRSKWQRNPALPRVKLHVLYYVSSYLLDAPTGTCRRNGRSMWTPSFFTYAQKFYNTWRTIPSS